MSKLTQFDEELVRAMRRTHDFDLSYFTNRYIEVLHEDGSKFFIKHSFMEQVVVGKFPCIIVYPEHNSPLLFVEFDLEKVIIQPYKGRRKKLKLARYKFKK